jgi:hypothetical protein
MRKGRHERAGRAAKCRPGHPRRASCVRGVGGVHHVADTEALLRRFHDLLSPRGIVCVVDLDAEDGAFHGPGFQGHNGFDRDELARQLGRAGFAEVRITTACEIAKETSAGSKRFPLFLATATRG